VIPTGRVEVESDDGETAVLALIGEIDLAVCEELRRELAGLTSPRVVIDLGETIFIDSLTIGTLLVAARHEGRTLTLRDACGAPLKALELSGVLHVFDRAP
jgi:anti-anti-sigma factor